MNPPRLLHGERVRLTAITEDDLPAMVPWWSDEDFARPAGDDPVVPLTAEVLKKIFISEDRWNIKFGVRRADDEPLIGFVALNVVSWPHRIGELGLGIGDRASWGQGFGAEAASLAIDCGFRELNLHRIQLSVFSYNTRAIGLYEKLGFQREGVQRQSLRRDGIWHDSILYGLLESEWPVG